MTEEPEGQKNQIGFKQNSRTENRQRKQEVEKECHMTQNTGGCLRSDCHPDPTPLQWGFPNNRVLQRIRPLFVWTASKFWKNLDTWFTCSSTDNSIRVEFAIHSKTGCWESHSFCGLGWRNHKVGWEMVGTKRTIASTVLSTLVILCAVSSAAKTFKWTREKANVPWWISFVRTGRERKGWKSGIWAKFKQDHYLSSFRTSSARKCLSAGLTKFKSLSKN